MIKAQDITIEPATVTLEGENRIVFTRKCQVTGIIYAINVSLEAFKEYANEGKHVQDAFPEIPPKHREIIMTGTTPDEWEMMMSPPDVDTDTLHED